MRGAPALLASHEVVKGSGYLCGIDPSPCSENCYDYNLEKCAGSPASSPSILSYNYLVVWLALPVC
jgi:hypothetical protein